MQAGEALLSSIPSQECSFSSPKYWDGGGCAIHGEKEGGSGRRVTFLL